MSGLEEHVVNDQGERAKKGRGVEVAALIVSVAAAATALWSASSDARALNYESRQDAYVEFINAGYALRDSCEWEVEGCVGPDLIATETVERAFLLLRLSGSVDVVENARDCLRDWGLHTVDESSVRNDVCTGDSRTYDGMTTNLHELTDHLADELA